ncbi:MAG TPA: phytoene/squalene synthase family protein [Steroidobacteraceae bacterium]|jgi:farnesyl-diphosphate farnesyltransferase|nr:phytoene/squalene synthase family protein [Steroidobacteraceae bacterium]
MDSGISDEGYQDQILPHVSRTFALTIPQLPEPLRVAVTNAYLLCRIADTIEDEPAVPPDQTLAFLDRFKAVVAGCGDAALLASEVAASLSDSTLPTERDLIVNMGRVLNITASLKPAQRSAIQRCVELMCYGMPRFQSTASLRGLARSADLDEYCYYVAGVVGEMLTELFCDYSDGAARNRSGLSSLAVSFAQGLQMTNILKDVWEDRSRGACWLPQEVFSSYKVDLSSLTATPGSEGFNAGMDELIGVAHAHLRNALDYTLLIPGKQAGMRRFCLWAVGLAVLTLQKIHKNPGFTSGAQVKISRSAVTMTRILTDLSVRNDWMLRRLFSAAARGLPLARRLEMRHVQPARAEGRSEITGDPATNRESEPVRQRSYRSSGS